MKKAPRSKSSTPYKCRKCLREDFQRPMEFTNHLTRCKGPVTLATVVAAIPPTVPSGNGKQIPQKDLVSMLREVSNKAGDLKSAVDQVIKRLS